jgi:hypothetical protein
VQALSTTRVELLISRTHFPGAQVIDWIDQAILYQHSGENGEMFFKLRSIGIRTSCNLLIAAGYRAKHDGSQQWSWAKDMDIEDGDAKVLAPIASALVDGEEDRAGRVVAARRKQVVAARAVDAVQHQPLGTHQYRPGSLCSPLSSPESLARRWLRLVP